MYGIFDAYESCAPASGAGLNDSAERYYNRAAYWCRYGSFDAYD